MSAWGRPGRFASRIDGHRAAKHLWGCLVCCRQHDHRVTQCEDCGAPSIQHFASQREANRYAQLRLLERGGQIEPGSIECQPKYPIIVITPAGIPREVGEYRADFRYRKDGLEVIEDVKGTTNEAGIDPLFRFKKRLVELAYGVTIHIVA